MTNNKDRVLIIGAFGQLGTELISALVNVHGTEHVIAADIRHQPTSIPTVELDVVDKKRLIEIIQQFDINIIYHLAAILSASGEQQPQLAWEVNMGGLLNVLDAAVNCNIKRLFWPSSIAVFGPTSPTQNTPQICIMDPTSMYGITKLAGERLCEYYHLRYGLDVRSLRYPGLISHTSPPGGGTTDYAVHIFYEALKHNRYTCFLKENTVLPMMYMPDAIRATLELMAAPAEKITVHTSYNLAGYSFAPKDVAAEIQKHCPGFECTYQPDFRQKIADTWPKTIDDSIANRDWGWKAEYDLPKMTVEMLTHLKPKLA